MKRLRLKRSTPLTPEERAAAERKIGDTIRATPKRPPVPKRHPVQAARRLAGSPTPTSEVGMCLRETRECFNVGRAAEDAIGAWRMAKRKHPTTNVDEIPGAVPIYWAGGSEGHGHVGIKAFRRGYCWSMDIRRPGYWDRVPISEIHDKWGLTFLGWTEDLNGVTVYEPEEVKK